MDQNLDPNPGARHAPWPGYQNPQPHPARRQRFPTWAKILIWVGAGGMLAMILMCSGLLYLGAHAPQTRALAGSQMSKRDLNTIRRLGLLGQDERLRYFYSDGLLSIEEGMYFFTDEKIVVYGKNLEPPATVVLFEDVVDIAADLSDNWFIDGTIWLELADGSSLVIPISCESGVDELYYDSLVKTWKSSVETAAFQKN